MGIDWGREAGAFADGLVAGSRAVSELRYYGAIAEDYRERAAERRRKTPPWDQIDKEVGIKAKPVANRIPTPGTPGMVGQTPGQWAGPVQQGGVIPFETAFPDARQRGYADGGEVLRARQRAALTAMDPAQAEGRSEQDLWDEEFRRLFLESNREDAPAPAVAPAAMPPGQRQQRTQQAQEQGRMEERDRAVGPALADRPPPQATPAPTRGVIDTAPAAPASRPPPQTASLQQAGRMEERDRAVGPALADKPGPMPTPVRTIPEMWPQVQQTLASSAKATAMQGQQEAGRLEERDIAVGPAMADRPQEPTTSIAGQVIRNIGNLANIPHAAEIGRLRDEREQLKPRWTQQTTASERASIERRIAEIDAEIARLQNTPETAPAAPVAGAAPPPPAGKPGISPIGETGGPTPSIPFPPKQPGQAVQGPPKPTGKPVVGGPAGAPTSRAAPATPGTTAPPPAARPGTPVVDTAQPVMAPGGGGVTITRNRSTAVEGPQGADLDGMLVNALNAGQRHAGRTYKLDASGQVVNTLQPGEVQGGQQLVLAGNGAAQPAAVAAIDRSLGTERFSSAMKSTMRLLAAYEFYSRTGQPEKADEVAYELIQYSAMVSAMYGKEALEYARRGDIGAAAQAVAEGYNQAPNGKEVRIDPKTGQATVYDLFTGKPEQSYSLDPRMIITLANGLQDKGFFFDLLAQRAQRHATKGERKMSPLQQEKMQADIELVRARIAYLRGKQQGGTATSADATQLNDLLRRYPDATTPGQGAPPGQQVSAAPDARLQDALSSPTGAPSGGEAPGDGSDTATLTGGSDQDFATGGAGSDTLSDAGAEPLPDGTQIAQAPVTPGSEGPRWNDPKYRGEVNTKGGTIVPHPDGSGRLVINDHNRPSTSNTYARSVNSFVPMNELFGDLMTPSEIDDYEHLKSEQARYGAMPGKAGARGYDIAKRGVDAWNRKIETRRKERTAALKAETKEMLAQKFSSAQAEALEASVKSAKDDPTIKPYVDAGGLKLDDGNVLRATQRIAETNGVSGRAALEALAAMTANPGKDKGRNYQVLGPDITGTGVIVQTGAIHTPFYVPADTMTLIDKMAASNIKEWQDKQNKPSLGQKFFETWDRLKR